MNRIGAILKPNKARKKQSTSVHNPFPKRTNKKNGIITEKLISKTTSLLFRPSTLHLLRLQRRKIKRLTLRRLPERPLDRRPRARTPPESPHPRLHIPAHIQRNVLPLRKPARDIRKLVFGFLAAQTEDARLRGGSPGFLLGRGSGALG